MTAAATANSATHRIVLEPSAVALLDSIGEAIFSQDRLGRCTFVNDACVKMLGYGREELLGHDVLALVRFDDDVITRKDGSSFPAEFRAYPLKENGAITGLAVMLVDVTERRRAEEQSRFQQLLLQAQSDTSLDGILVVDKASKMISLNQRFIDMWGVPTEIIASRSDDAALKWVLDKLADPQQFISKVVHLYDHIHERSYDELLLKDGRRFDRYSAPVISSEGVYYGRVWFFRDITERTRVNQELRASTQRYHMLYAKEQAARAQAESAQRRIEFLYGAMTALLADELNHESRLGTIARLAVPHMADLCLVDLVEADGTTRRVAAVHAELDKTDAATKLATFTPDLGASDGISKVLRDGQIVVRESIAPEDFEPGRSEHAIGTINPEELALFRELGLRSFISVPLSARGRIFGALTFCTTRASRTYGPNDIAQAADLASRAALAIDNARLYREVREAVGARDDFLSMAGHELKTPLAALQLQVQSLQRLARQPDGARDPARFSARLDKAGTQVDRLKLLIDELLDVARISARQLSIQPCDVDLAFVVREVSQRFTEELGRSGSTLAIDVPEEVRGYWDPFRLDQVVTNLTSNAIKYGNGRPIDVRVHATESVATIEVEDRGIGIDPSAQARIFGRFERAVSERHYGGIGLGLWIVRQVVEAMGGSIRFESAPDVGTTFFVELRRKPVAEGRE